MKTYTLNLTINNIMINYIASLLRKIIYFIPNIINSDLLKIESGLNDFSKLSLNSNIRVSAKMETYITLPIVVFGIIAIVNAAIAYTYKIDIESMLTPVDPVFFNEIKSNFNFFKNIALHSTAITLFFITLSIFLMSISAGANIFRKKEDKHYLLIGIDLFRIFSKTPKLLLIGIYFRKEIRIHTRSWF